MVRKNVAEIVTNQVTFELEAIDRMYLNATCRRANGRRVRLVREDPARRARAVDDAMVAPMSERFVKTVERIVETAGTRPGHLREGQRKDDVAHEYLARFERR